MTARLYGFVGAHRTGKTTLARLVAKELGVPFEATSVSNTLRLLGVDPKRDMSFTERLFVQDLILKALLAEYERALDKHPNEALIIVDRTPIDVLGYTMSEVLRETITPNTLEVMVNHDERCIHAFNFSFAGACMVQPGIPLVDDASKATASVNIFYQRHVHATMLEAILRPHVAINTLILGVDNVAMKSRVSDAADHCESIITLLSQNAFRDKGCTHAPAHRPN